MDDVTYEINTHGDSDDFMTFQCPYCNNTFKLDAGECQEDDVIELFCPYCGLVDEPNSFLNDEIIQLAMDKAENYMIDLINDFSKDIERIFKGNSCVKVKTDKICNKAEKEVFEVDTEDVEVKLGCCERHVKVKLSAKESGIICPYCGVR